MAELRQWYIAEILAACDGQCDEDLSSMSLDMLAEAWYDYIHSAASIPMGWSHV